MNTILSPEQSRAARGWLDWSQAELAERAGVGLSTVRDFEKGRTTPVARSLRAMCNALEKAGIGVVFDGDTPAGIVRICAMCGADGAGKTDGEAL